MKIGEDGYPIVDEWKACPGAQAGALTLIELSHYSDDGRPYWKCKCAHCGEIVVKRQDRLSAGARGLKRNAVRNCGYQQKKVISNPNIKGRISTKHTETTLGGLKIIKRTDYIDRNRSSIVLVECPICKKIYPTSTRYISKGLRCNGHPTIEEFITDKRGMSKNEMKIMNLLKDNNISFIFNKKFEDCCDERPLPFDFYIEDPVYGKYVIEYDGEQHFQEWSLGNSTLKERRKRDILKNHFLFNNNIRLIRIPYNKEYTLDDLKIHTTRYEITMENEQEYYK